MSQPQAYEHFLALHARTFIMPNAWDGASAVLLKRAGFEALGSTSLAIAFALGRLDGFHAISRDIAMENASMLARLTGLPINGDLEDGFGPSPEDCALTVRAAIAGGLAGLGIEDTTADPQHPIHDFDAAVARIKGAVQAARGRIVLTARTDNFLQGRPDLDDTIRRLVAFAELGADVLYAPGLPDLDAIKKVVRAVAPKPVNVVVGPRSGPVPLKVLEEAGVKRVSLGGALYRRVMADLVQAAEALKNGDIASAAKGIAHSEIIALLPKV
ncbi:MULTISPECIES: isocitrate lyase/phosphoenolpyruvate mutase family protein [unclassified Beijerinckia]|uniref:isocitrate lyase/PEP mutase family protein n=1 Tax=unclassified Beijerinckia TaxID=2638183 RepID=UPI0008963087|nr:MULTISPECIES: isocitrate lyase/phosphoenolpyruvate mutase family protein [unclassified Beijerinckia]MDH7796229.1 2-methylisocitrate lyase-like PEP mutase family enzyme [Beijerinckia sp. GAS462]SEC36023.1 2-Methylisocitrate lyase, PEP mutase family [Beijerinckia sp. 28-YEA-48]